MDSFIEQLENDVIGDSLKHIRNEILMQEQGEVLQKKILISQVKKKLKMF